MPPSRPTPQRTSAVSEPEIRPAARVVVLDPQGCVLLQRFRRDDGTDIWITPGGAIEPGESPDQAACRELAEEIGLMREEVGPPIWTRRHVFRWADKHYDQRETFFLVELVERYEPAPALTAEQIVGEGIAEQRWWAIDELDAAGVACAPRRLVALLRSLRSDGPPAEPVDIGV